MANVIEIAEWMLEEFKRYDILDQRDAAHGIEKKFGSEYVYTNKNGHLAISKEVLNEFKKLTMDTIVWEPRKRRWRFRDKYDDKDNRARRRNLDF